MKTAVFVILDRFADWEPAYLSSALNGEVTSDYLVFFASTDTLPKTSIGGMTVLPQLALDEVPQNADAIIFIGADGSWHKPQEKAEQLAISFRDRGKVVAGICDAARWLGSIGLLNDVRHTLNDLDEMKDYPEYTNRSGYQTAESIRDGKIVTANGNAPLDFTANVLRALDAAPEEKIQEYYDFYALGFHNALKKYGYVQ